MKKLSIILSVLLLVPLLTVSGLAADDYENPGAFNKFGTKSYGMGGAFTAVADDASTIYWNPAGLTQSNLIGVQASAGSQLSPSDIKGILSFIKDVKDVDADTLSISEAKDQIDFENLPNNLTINVNGMAAANLTKFGVGGIANDTFRFEKTGLEFSEETKDRLSEEELETLEDEIKDKVNVPAANNDLLTQGLVGYGTNIIDPPIIGSIAIGGTGKFLYMRSDRAKFKAHLEEDATLNDLDVEKDIGYKFATSDNEPQTGFGADVGALATLSDIDILNAKAGVTVRNAFSTLDADYPTLQRSVTLGTGLTFKFPLVEVLSARVAGDLEILEPTGAAKKVQRLGAEGTVGPFSVRGGVYGTDIKDGDQRTITGGVGLNLPFIDFNLAADSDAYVNFSGTFNF